MGGRKGPFSLKKLPFFMNNFHNFWFLVSGSRAAKLSRIYFLACNKTNGTKATSTFSETKKVEISTADSAFSPAVSSLVVVYAAYRKGGGGDGRSEEGTLEHYSGEEEEEGGGGGGAGDPTLTQKDAWGYSFSFWAEVHETLERAAVGGGRQKKKEEEIA